MAHNMYMWKIPIFPVVRCFELVLTEPYKWLTLTTKEIKPERYISLFCSSSFIPSELFAFPTNFKIPSVIF